MVLYEPWLPWWHAHSLSITLPKIMLHQWHVAWEVLHLWKLSMTNFMEFIPSWDTASCAAIQELPSILWFFTVFTRILHWSLSWARWIQSYPVSKICFNILHHLCLGLPSDLFPYGFPTSILYAFLFLHVHASCPAHLVLLGLIIIITLGKEYKLWSSLLCNYFQPPVT
jgi:hypothetical protein